LNEKIFEPYKQKISLRNHSYFQNVKFRSIGPTIMGGRVVDVDVSPTDPTIFYVAYASGGLWRTSNNGISFTPLFDNQPGISIGDIAVDWKNGEVIYVGTGENNSSRSSYSGTGIYKSTDKGISWENIGLPLSNRTGRIILHPNDSKTIFVGVIGNLYTTNKERGIYKTVDGGKSWKNVLFIDDTTGVIDLVLNPKDPNILYAAAWYRTRKAWNMVEAGNQSAIYKSIDGGESWEIINKGLPSQGIGRIGLSIFPNNPEIVYALIDNQNIRQEKKDIDPNILTKEKLRVISKDDFLKLNDEQINRFLDDNDFPEKYNAKKIKELISSDSITVKALLDFINDDNEKLFSTNVVGGELYRSDDGGKNWKNTHEGYVDDFYYSYGYYFGGVKVSPINADKVYIFGVPLLVSTDKGKTFKSINEDNVHADHHAFWINENREGHLIDCNDGGINISYDDGANWFKVNQPAVGQFYHITVDMSYPYNVYGGLQDNGVWYGPSTYSPNFNWQDNGSYPFKNILGGDGMQTAVDTTNNNTIYTGFQFGYYYRIEKSSNKRADIKPLHELGNKPFRFNWQAPIIISSHNSDILYMGAEKLFRSMDKGNTWWHISDDLTKGGIPGDVPYGTIVSIHESPLKFGLLYVGTDDGNVQLSKDGGANWNLINNGLPQNLWVSRVQASAFKEGRVYLSLNGYRNDDNKSYLYSSEDFGSTWNKIGLTLPDEPINVVKEDVVNQNILYVGTDNGVYVSLDRGKTFMEMFNGLPSVPVHDLVIHPRENELVVGTHGRSIYIADVSHIQKLDDTIIKKEVYLFTINNIDYDEYWGKKTYTWGDFEKGNNQIVYFSKVNNKAVVKIKTEDGLILKEITDSSEAGLNYINYDLSIDDKAEVKYASYIKDKSSRKKEDKNHFVVKKSDDGKIYLLPGKYLVEVNINGQKEEKEFEVKQRKATRM
ncbi:MAG: VPS10 domain-containing protein, partial [Syntrophothermus sp.]